MKTVKFSTLGCKVNQYETQAIREQFLRAGFKELNNGRAADIYVINTCTVTHRADTESLQLIRRAQRENPNAKVIVTGCLTELDGDKVREAGADCLIVKNKDKENLLDSVSDFNGLSGHSGQTGLTDKGISFFGERTRAFMKIQDGCNNRCSYCKVPLVRGRSRSRPLEEIIVEARRLVKNGFKEIVLTGICLGSYGKKGDVSKRPLFLVDVISALEDIDGLLRIRLSSIEAGDVSNALIEKIANSKKLCRHLHIPVQSGDDDILKRMNRNYRQKDYSKLISRIKNKIPEIAITTDVIVGFPSETEANFENTVKLIKEITPLKTHIFPYSEREGTAACSFKDKVTPGAIRERISLLKGICENCALDYKKQFLNKKMNVLIEGRSQKLPGFWEGCTDNYIKVLVGSKNNLQNEYILLKLKDIRKDSLLADFS